MMGPARLLGADITASQTLAVQSGTGSWEGISAGRRVPSGASLQSSGYQRRRQSTAKHRTPLPSTSGRHQAAWTLCAEDHRRCSSAACSAVTKASANLPGLLLVSVSERSGQARRPGALSSSSAFIQQRLPSIAAGATHRNLLLRSRKLPPCRTSAMVQEGEGEGSASQSTLELDHLMMRQALELAVSCKGKYCRFSRSSLQLLLPVLLLFKAGSTRISS